MTFVENQNFKVHNKAYDEDHLEKRKSNFFQKLTLTLNEKGLDSNEGTDQEHI